MEWAISVPPCIILLVLSAFGHLWQNTVGLVLFSIAREKQEGARQALFAGIKKLINQIFFDADIAHQHVCNEMIGQLMLFVKHA